MTTSVKSLLYTTVRFTVDVELASYDKTVYLVGDVAAIGNWEPHHALRMRRVYPRINPNKVTWEVDVELLTGTTVNYKYILISKDQRIKWESSKQINRTLHLQGYSMKVADEFGVADSDMVWIDEGWLASDYQLRLSLGFHDPFNGTHTRPIENLSPQLANHPLSLHFYDNATVLSRQVISLSEVGENEFAELVFRFSSLESIKIFVDLYDHAPVDPNTRYLGENGNWERIGRSSLTAIQLNLKELYGRISLPVFNMDLDQVCTFNFKYQIVCPFHHPNNTLSRIWEHHTARSKPLGILVGNRGSGSTRTTVISENTIFSFLTAASFGADFVEFDVHLTKEGTPVIHHDFLIDVHSSNGKAIRVPISSITKKQFKSLRPVSADSPIDAAFKIAGIKKSRSSDQLFLGSKTSKHSQELLSAHPSNESLSSMSVSSESSQAQNSTRIEFSSDSSTESLIQTPSSPPPTTSEVPVLDLNSGSLQMVSEAPQDNSKTMPLSNGTGSSQSASHPVNHPNFPAITHIGKPIVNPRDGFATLDESLRIVPSSVGFLIEIKYPSERFQYESQTRYHERNYFVDAVLTSVFNSLSNPSDPPRRIMFISFDPDICILLSQKQPSFPVLFLVSLGKGRPVGPDDDEVEGFDPRCSNFQTACKFARSVRLHGIVSDAALVLNNSEVVSQAHELGLLYFTYGAQNMNSEERHKQKLAGVDSFIMDNVVHINKDTRNRNSISTLLQADIGRQHLKLSTTVSNQTN